MSAEAVARLLDHLVATDGDALADVSTRLRGARANLRGATLDVVSRALIIPLSQEPFGAGGITPRHLRRTWLYDEYELPYLEHRLIVHGAGRVRSRDPLDLPVSVYVSDVVHYPAIDALRVEFHDGSWLEVPVGSVFVELEVTDRVTATMRRRVGRLIPYDATYEAPPRKDALD
jgi:hypothetical protein